MQDGEVNTRRMFWKLSLSLCLVAVLVKAAEARKNRPAGAIPSPYKDGSSNHSERWQHQIKEVLASSQEALVVTERKYLKSDWCKTQPHGPQPLLLRPVQLLLHPAPRAQGRGVLPVVRLLQAAARHLRPRGARVPRHGPSLPTQKDPEGEAVPVHVREPERLGQAVKPPRLPASSRGRRRLRPRPRSPRGAARWPLRCPVAPPLPARLPSGASPPRPADRGAPARPTPARPQRAALRARGTRLETRSAPAGGGRGPSGAARPVRR
ncbi:gremlin-2 isoform X2 [Mustela erminea]|uniref:gremlin-2 isoform X2 n=1 Tax=Mustela erminea TaxID=36723 RepID=UPI0013868DDF|nr:gremlin-2 isoform X2 [Mustela erminea]